MQANLFGSLLLTQNMYFPDLKNRSENFISNLIPVQVSLNKVHLFTLFKIKRNWIHEHFERIHVNIQTINLIIKL